MGHGGKTVFCVKTKKCAMLFDALSRLYLGFIRALCMLYPCFNEGGMSEL